MSILVGVAGGTCSQRLSVNVIYDDVWTDPALRAADESFAWTYGSPGLSTPAPVRSSCISNWNSTCRTIINYVQHIQPIWTVERMVGGENRTCTTCHAPPTATGLMEPPAGQLDLSGDPSFRQLVDRVRDTATEAIAHQELPFEQLVKAMQPRRDPGRNPLFQINFTHQRDFVRPVSFGGARLTAFPSRSPGAIFDLHFFMVERAEGWRVTCDFSTDLFDHATARRMLGHYRRLLEGIAAAPEKRLSELEVLTEEERETILGDWATGGSEAPPRRSHHGGGLGDAGPDLLRESHVVLRAGGSALPVGTIPSFFAETVSSHAHRTALVFGEQSLTYA